MAAKKGGQTSLFEATHSEQRKRTGTRKRKRTTKKKATTRSKSTGRQTVADKLKKRHPKDTAATRKKRVAARKSGKVHVEGYTRKKVTSPRSKKSGRFTKGRRK